MVAFADDDGILLTELVEVGECRSEHRVGRHVRMATLLVVFLEVCLHRGNVADETLLRQEGKHLLKSRDRIFHGHGIDHQLGTEVLHFLYGGETLAIVGEAQPLRIFFQYADFVIKTQQVGKEGAHLTGSHNQYSHVISV